MLLASFNFLLPEKASSFSGEVDWLFNFVTWITVIFSLIIFVGVGWLTWKFRHQPGKNDIGRGPTHSNLLEIVWSVIPLIIVLLIAIWGFQGYMNISIMPPPNDADTLEINVEAYKWGWRFIYPNGYQEPALHVPVGMKVRIVQTSQDVIHSLFLPEFRVKKDVVPGRFNKHWFEATKISPIGLNVNTQKELDWTEPDSFALDTDEKTGEVLKTPQNAEKEKSGFDIYCTEYCGTGHSRMLSKVYVHPTVESFNAWLAKASDPYRAKDGVLPAAKDVGLKLVKNNGCLACHSLDGATGIGPTWHNLVAKEGKFTDGTSYTATEDYIRESILYPQKHIVAGFGGAMPSFLGKLSDRDIAAIIAFQKSISPDTFKGAPTEITNPVDAKLNSDKSKTK